MDIGLHADGLRFYAQRVAQGAIGVRKAEEEIRVLVGCGAGDYAPIAEQHLELEHGVVHEAVAVRGRLDADARDGAAERDGLQLRHDRGHDAVREAVARQVLVRDHALGVDPAGLRVDREHLVEAAHVEPAPGDGLPIAKQVRCFLRETDRSRAVPKPRG